MGADAELPSPIRNARHRVTLERTFEARIEDVWDLWTTKEGIESWWGPEGFTVSVRNLDLRPGGQMEYSMTANDPDQIEFMRKAGMPVTNQHRLTFTEVVPRERLAYDQMADFIPGVKPYEVATVVEFEVGPQGVKMALTFDAMHDDYWTEMATRGWESELDKLASALRA
jgi:uncharacterized protein YndB with AHSA1/START domain